jgi:formylglycine-generating enzyme required for sulfatase activity
MWESKRWLTLVLAILMFAVTGCDRKVAVPPEANPQVGVSIEAELLKPQETPEQQEEPKPPALPEMVFVEGGVFDFHGKQVEVDSFYISKYELTPQALYHCESWAVKKGIQDKHHYVFSAVNVRPILPDFYTALYICNLFSMQGGYRPVYYLDPDLVDMLAYSDTFKVPAFIYLDKDPKVSVEYSFMDFYIDNTADGFRLPTEVEWVYAARGGNKSQGFIYSGSDIAEEVAWFGKSEQDFIQVGSKKGNELGLYDMSGNAHEWCIDYWSDEPLVDTALRNEIYFYEMNTLPKIRLIKGGFNFDTNGIYEESIMDYLRPDMRLKMDFYRYRYEDDTSGGLGNFFISLVTTESGLRLVQKRHE